MIPYQLLYCGDLQPISMKFPAYLDRIFTDTPIMGTLLDLAISFTENGQGCIVISGEMDTRHLYRRLLNKISEKEASCPGYDKTELNGLCLSSTHQSAFVTPRYCKEVIDRRRSVDNPKVVLVDWLETGNYDALKDLKDYVLLRGMAVIYAKQLPHAKVTTNVGVAV